MGAKFRFYNPPLFSTIRVEMFGPPFRHFGGRSLASRVFHPCVRNIFI